MEEFRNIFNYGDYSVSNKGNVRKDKTGKILKIYKKNKYNIVTLKHNNGDRKRCYIKDLVQDAFNGDNEKVYYAFDKNIKTECWCSEIPINGEIVINYFCHVF